MNGVLLRGYRELSYNCYMITDRYIMFAVWIHMVELQRLFSPGKEPDDEVLFFMRDSIRIGFDNVSYRNRFSGKHKHE